VARKLQNDVVGNVLAEADTQTRDNAMVMIQNESMDVCIAECYGYSRYEPSRSGYDAGDFAEYDPASPMYEKSLVLVLYLYIIHKSDFLSHSALL